MIDIGCLLWILYAGLEASGTSVSGIEVLSLGMMRFQHLSVRSLFCLDTCGVNQGR